MLDIPSKFFSWVSDTFLNARIAYDFNSYEKRCERGWNKKAAIRYSTASHEKEIEILMREPLSHWNAQYVTAIKGLQAEAAETRKTTEDAEQTLKILERNYERESDQIGRKTHQLKGELELLKKNLERAYADLECAKNDLDAWYRHAEGRWLGNKGKELPKHSFFGQDLSTRDTLKAKRNRASHEIGDYKNQRLHVNDRLKTEYDKLQSIKKDQKRMMDLRRQGFDERLTKGVIKRGNDRIVECGSEIARLEREGEEFLKKAKLDLGITQLEQRIVQIDSDREAFIRSFYTKTAKEARRARHRSMWIRGTRG